MSDIEQQVCNDILRRQQLGIAKYGTTVAANPLELRQWLQHAYEECLDQAVYLRRAIDEIEREQEQPKRIETLENALRQIVKHQKLIGAGIVGHSTTVLIAERALNDGQ